MSTPSTALGSFQTAALLSEHWPPPASNEAVGFKTRRHSSKSSSACSGCFVLPVSSDQGAVSAAAVLVPPSPGAKCSGSLAVWVTACRVSGDNHIAPLLGLILRMHFGRIRV
eukprot:6213905-Pleurochrysis_carterae.AAC.2